MFWVDKYLILRFHRYPKNYDIAPINFVLFLLRFTIIFHLFWGALFISNNDILKNNEKFKPSIEALNRYLEPSGFSINTRFSSSHVVLFIFANLIIVLLTIFESTVIKTIMSGFKKFKDIQKQFDEMEALTDDYYNEMHVNFLLNEYLRTKIERKTYQ